MAFLLVVLGAGAAQAQTPQDVGRALQQQQQIQQEQQQRERQQRELEEQRRRTPSGQDLTPKPPAPAPEGGACSSVREIVLEGADLLDAAEQTRLAAPYLDRCLTLADINRLVGDITNRYVELGYVTTRVYIPQQDLGAGKLQLKVVEGRVQSLRVEPPASASAATAFPGVEGTILNLRDLEQGIDQVNRLQSNAAKIDIRPGSEPGASDVVVRNEPRKRWLAALGLDNSGSLSTGRWLWSASVGADHLLGLNDYLNFSYRHSEELGPPQFSDSAGLFFAVPYGYWTFAASINDFRYASVVQGTFTTFDSTGTSATQGLRADRVVYRDQALKWGVGGGLTFKQTRNFIAGALIEGSSPDLAVADLATNLSVVTSGALLSFDLGAAQGLDELGATRDDPSRPFLAPQAQFRKYTYGASVLVPFAVQGMQASWRSSIAGQYSTDSLYGTEQIAIGNLYTVRGFRTTSLPGRSGYYARNELGVQLPYEGVQFRPYLAYDFGHVETAGSLQGWAAGVDISLPSVTLQLAVAAPVSVPDRIRKEDGWLYVRLALTF